MQQNLCAVYDFTIFEKFIEKEALVVWCDKQCKNWVFQLEETEKGDLHYQGRIRTKVRTRLTALIKITPCKECRWSITHDSKDEHFDFYATKSESHVEGPWRDGVDDPVQYREYLDVKWYPWQKEVIKIIQGPRLDRKIIYIYNPEGNSGKTTLALWLACNRMTHYLPCMKDFKDIMRAAMDLPEYLGYYIDNPRCSKFTDEFWQGIEILKGGYCYDDRYKFAYKILQKIPFIIIQSNILPDLDSLILDRWMCYHICPDTKELHPMSYKEVRKGDKSIRKWEKV